MSHVYSLAAGALLDVADDEGYAPLHLAIEAADGPNIPLIKLLIQVSQSHFITH